MSEFEDGQIYLFDLDRDPLNEDMKTRPCVILQVCYLNALETLIVVPLTSCIKRGGQATGVALSHLCTGLEMGSIAQAHLVYSLQKSNLSQTEPIGRVHSDDLKKIRFRLARFLGIDADVVFSEGQSDWDLD
ncbi:MAG: type II toxin-antitoxin system PemK/MazF family toxin [Planctomycetota bacterium]|nr:type II toxin-antitoxin system PemK/MazF family toxin [Planctomycetota bacterium]